MEEVRARGRDIAPRPDGTPVAIAVARQALLEAISRGVSVDHEQEVVALLRDGGRVVGVRVRGPEGEREIASDLVVGADGTHSPVRTMAGIAAEVRPSPGAALSFRSPVLIEDAFRMAYQ